MFAIKPSAFLLLSAIAVGCGGSQQQVVKMFSYTIKDNIISFNLEFNQTVQMNTEMNIPILNYGSFTLTPATKDRGFGIGGSINMGYVNDGRIVTLNRTRNLPNAQPMPSYITHDLAQIRIASAPLLTNDIYLGLDTQHLFIGTALELGYIDEKFPAALTLSFNIVDKQNRPVGVVSIFGPNVQNGKLIAPGGIFFATNVTDLISYYGSQPKTIIPEPIYDKRSFETLVEVNDSYHDEYMSNPRKIEKFFRKVDKAGRKAGMINEAH